MDAEHRTDCNHQECAAPKQVCTHLFNSRSEEYYRLFTNHLNEYQLICSQCKKYLSKFELTLKTICRSCFDKIESDYDFIDFLGKPEIQEAPCDLHFNHRQIEIPALSGKHIRAIKAINGLNSSQWLLFDGIGNLILLDLNNNLSQLITNLDSEQVNLHGSISLSVSDQGDFAAIVSRVQQHAKAADSNQGVVINLKTGLKTMTLHRGDYYTEVSQFSVAFFVRDNKTYIVHSTDWNRLDISDPETGECLTQRSFEQRPEEAWRFKQSVGSEFFGDLTVSPNHKRIADFGWVWHPVGQISTWKISNWLDRNIWESDNGPSKFDLNQYQYYWDGPVCWINDDTLCAWGLGDDEENLIPGAMIFRANDGSRINWFPGPGPQLFVYDQYLFSSTIEEHSTSVWNVKTGARVHHENNFAPHVYHHGNKEFLTILDDGQFIASKLSSSF